MMLKTAVSGSILDAAGALVKPEKVLLRINGEDRGECRLDSGKYLYGTYNCPEGGEGNYEVTVLSGGQSISQTVFVEADECHVKTQETANFVVAANSGNPCPDVMPLVAEIDTSSVDGLPVGISESDAFRAPLAESDGKLRVFANPGLLAGVEQSLSIWEASSQERCLRTAQVPFVPQPKDCSYEPVSLRLTPDMLSCN